MSYTVQHQPIGILIWFPFHWSNRWILLVLSKSWLIVTPCLLLKSLLLLMKSSQLNLHFCYLCCLDLESFYISWRFGWLVTPLKPCFAAVPMDRNVSPITTSALAVGPRPWRCHRHWTCHLHKCRGQPGVTYLRLVWGYRIWDDMRVGETMQPSSKLPFS